LPSPNIYIYISVKVYNHNYNTTEKVFEISVFIRDIVIIVALNSNVISFRTKCPKDIPFSFFICLFDSDHKDPHRQKNTQTDEKNQKKTWTDKNNKH